jgi:hypothetical protein
MTAPLAPSRAYRVSYYRSTRSGMMPAPERIIYAQSEQAARAMYAADPGVVGLTVVEVGT